MRVYLYNGLWLSQPQYRSGITDTLIQEYEGKFDLVCADGFHRVTKDDLPGEWTELVPASKAATPQPMPKPGQTVVKTVVYHILKNRNLDHLIPYIEKQQQKGESHYGSPLMTFNGRDTDEDICDEDSDSLMYKAQKWLETSRIEDFATFDRAIETLNLVHYSIQNKPVTEVTT